jgi:hypothetical protein
MGDRLGVTLKAQQSDYNPNQEKLDSSRAKADVELINSSVDEIPEAVSYFLEENLSNHSFRFPLMHLNFPLRLSIPTLNQVQRYTNCLYSLSS